MRLQFGSVSIAQLLAGICIMLMHYTLFLRGTQFEPLHRWFGEVAFSEFFFFSSGFFVHLSSQNGRYATAGRFVFRRLVAIYPLHLLTALFFIVSIELFSRPVYLGLGNSKLACYASHLSLTHSAAGLNSLCLNGPSWFLSAIFLCYLAYVPARLLILACGRRWLLALIVCVLALDQGLHLYSADYRQLAVRTFDFGVLRALPAFFGGIAVAEYLPEIRKLKAPQIAPWLLFAANVVAFVSAAPLLVSHWLMQGLLLVLFVAASDDRQGAPSALARFSRTASFPLFLVHYPIGLLIVNLGAEKGLKLHGLPYLLSVIAAMFASVAAAYVIGRLKAPLERRFLEAIRADQPAVSPVGAVASESRAG